MTYGNFPPRDKERNRAWCAVERAKKWYRVSFHRCAVPCCRKSKKTPEAHHPFGYDVGWVVFLCRSCHRRADHGTLDTTSLEHQWVYKKPPEHQPEYYYASNETASRDVGNTESIGVEVVGRTRTDYSAIPAPDTETD